MKSAALLLFPVAFLLLTGCSTMSEPKVYDAERGSLVVIEVEGRVEMTWNSLQDRNYTIIYSDSRNAPIDAWKPLPGYIDIKGTGGQMSARDRIPLGSDRSYRLRTGIE